MADTQVAIVTGGSRGIGRAVAERLARNGVAVVVNYFGSVEAANEVSTAALEAGGQAMAVRANVTDPAQVTALFDEAHARFGGIDIVVASAGVLRTARIAEASELAPANRIGQPADVADAVSLIVSRDGAWINGQVLRVNGGAA